MKILELRLVRKGRAFPHWCCGRAAVVAVGLLGQPAYALQSIGLSSRGMLKENMLYLFILDSLGNTELLLILLAALIFFGPRKLPQLSRQIGRSLSEFRRASEDFKRTWEREVNLENFDKGSDPENSIFDRASERIRSAREAVAGELNFESPETKGTAPAITPVDPALVEPRNGEPQTEPGTTNPPKHEWL